MGRCEWTFAIYQCPSTTAESSTRRSSGGCPSALKDLDFYGISLAGAIPTPHNNGYQIGTAWGEFAVARWGHFAKEHVLSCWCKWL